MFYKSFKSLANDKDIPELLDPNGGLVSTWEEMAGMATSFFEGMLGTTLDNVTLPTEAEFNEVLYAQHDLLTPQEKQNLNAPLSLT